MTLICAYREPPSHLGSGRTLLSAWAVRLRTYFLGTETGTKLNLTSFLPFLDMDTGHYNCRDYHITPHFAPTTLTNNGRYQLPRHESWSELEHRARSPASFKSKFPLLKLPLELRQQILSYLLPKTKETSDANPLTSHARNFSAVQKRGAKGMILPSALATTTSASSTNVVWQKGNIDLFSVCRQLHNECAELVYGSNTFLLFITFSGITFRFRWLLPSGLAPSRSYPFLELLPERYLRLVKRVVVHIDHVDSYTGMIKFNVGGKGLTHGLRRQVQRLVNALKTPPRTAALMGDNMEVKDSSDERKPDERQLSKLIIRVSNGNAVLDTIKSGVVRQREGGINSEVGYQYEGGVKSEVVHLLGNGVKPDIVRPRESGVKVSEDLETMLEPFRQLYGVREVSVRGAVTESFARDLEASMRSPTPPDHITPNDGKVDDAGMDAPLAGVCVYGNDI